MAQKVAARKEYWEFEQAGYPRGIRAGSTRPRAKPRRRLLPGLGLALALALIFGAGALLARGITRWAEGAGSDSPHAFEAPDAAQPAPPAAQEGSALAQIEALLPVHPEVAPILAAPEAYPAALLELLARNPETVGFVLGYPGRPQAAAGDYAFEATRGTLPHLLQWDERWGYEGYGGGLMAINGCAPVCLAMVSAQLTGNPQNTPTAIAAFAEAGGFYQPGTGTAWLLMGQGCAPLGFTGREIPLDENTLKTHLAAGSPIICSMGPGDFTTAGHFVVLWGVAENGDLLVKDPNSIENTERSWPYDILSPQIKNLWAYTANE